MKNLFLCFIIGTMCVFTLSVGANDADKIPEGSSPTSTAKGGLGSNECDTGRTIVDKPAKGKGKTEVKAGKATCNGKWVNGKCT